VVAVALKRAVIECGVCEDIIRLKWPNDVLITDQKLAGILIEAHDNHLILGTGVNIEHAPEDRAKIKDHHPISVNDFRDLFLKHLCDCYEDWDIKGFNGIRDEWLKHAYKIGEDIQARLPNITYEGVFEDLDSNGILLLREKSGYLRKIHSGEILNQRDVEQRR
jgi:BirA family biotin operon repressor/biotin-[acetyl-CoA-carboxylase] ligase